MNDNTTSDKYPWRKPSRIIRDKAMDIGRTATHHVVIKEIFNSTIMKKISISVYFNHWMCKEYHGLEYIVKHSKNFKHSGKGNVIFNTFYTEKYTTKLVLQIPNIETYLLMEDNRTICHLEPVKIDSLEHDGDSKLLKVTFIGKNAYRYMHEFTKVVKKHYMIRTHGQEKGDIKSVCLSIVKEDSVSNITYKLCDFNDIIMKNKESLIIEPLESFFKAKDLYTKYKVTYKLGILLYGVPGTGKTTLTRAIINAALEKFHTCCYLMNLNTKSESLEKQIDAICGYAINNNNSLFGYKSPINVVILEEIDSVFPKNRDNCSDEQLEKINILLQFLDGPRTPNNTIFIATTNRKDMLDEAMVRDGRFNIQINMDNFDKDEAEEMCNRYDVPIKEIINMKDNDKVVPATLQKLIFNYIMDTKVLHKEEKN